MAEIALYDHVLTSDERVTITNGLKNKYGIA